MDVTTGPLARTGRSLGHCELPMNYCQDGKAFEGLYDPITSALNFIKGGDDRFASLEDGDKLLVAIHFMNKLRKVLNF